MGNNYNAIARIYDALSRILFQRSIINAQVFLVEFINDNSKVLVAGGGTGWILEKISDLNRKNISVVYIEKSSAMIELSKKRNYKNIHADFINTALEECILKETFDVIITPFFFDNFSENKIQTVFAQLDNILKQNGLWLYADFVNDKANKKLWQQLLLKMMYLFFKLTTEIETQTLTDMQPYFLNKYKLLAEQFYYSGFIQGKIYKKVLI